MNAVYTGTIKSKVEWSNSDGTVDTDTTIKLTGGEEFKVPFPIEFKTGEKVTLTITIEKQMENWEKQMEKDGFPENV